MYIFPHNCIVCVRMVISFYPATRSHVHFSREVRSFCATAPASGRSGAGAGLGVLNSSVPLESLGPVQLPLFIFTFEVKMLRKFKSFGNQCKLTPSFEVSLQAISIYQRKLGIGPIKSKTFGNKTACRKIVYNNNRPLALSSRLVQTPSPDDVYGHVIRVGSKSIFFGGGA